MASIYQITREMAYLQQIMLQDPDPELEAEIQEHLKITADRLEEKAVDYVHVMKNMEADIAGIRAEEKRLADRRKRLESTVERLKNTLHAAMLDTGKTSFERGNFSFKIAKNGGALPVVVDVPVEDLPPELTKTKVEADKTAIAEYMNDTGDFSYSHFEERGTSLRIK